MTLKSIKEGLLGKNVLERLMDDDERQLDAKDLEHDERIRLLNDYALLQLTYLKKYGHEYNSRMEGLG